MTPLRRRETQRIAEIERSPAHIEIPPESKPERLRL